MEPCVETIRWRTFARPAATVVLGLTVALVAPAGCSETGVAVSEVVVEADSPATRGERLGESIQIETSAGELAPILARGCPLPCTEEVTFATFADDQSEIVLYVFRGEGPTTDAATPLGVFEIRGFPAVPGVETEVDVVFRASARGITLGVEPGRAGAIEVHRMVEEAPRAQIR